MNNWRFSRSCMYILFSRQAANPTPGVGLFTGAELPFFRIPPYSTRVSVLFRSSRRILVWSTNSPCPIFSILPSFGGTREGGTEGIISRLMITAWLSTLYKPHSCSSRFPQPWNSFFLSDPYHSYLKYFNCFCFFSIYQILSSPSHLFRA